MSKIVRKNGNGRYSEAVIHNGIIYISGQVKREDLVGNQGIRQFGIQETDILSIVRSVTKYAVQIQKPEDICFEMEKAAAIAKEGRPGPVWVDIPFPAYW